MPNRRTCLVFVLGALGVLEGCESDSFATSPADGAGGGGLQSSDGEGGASGVTAGGNVGDSHANGSGGKATTGNGAGGGGTGSGRGGGGAPEWVPTDGTGLLPEGDTGIAALYPGDVGIDSHSAVIFADDFESYSQPTDLTSNGKWNDISWPNQARIATESANVYAGGKSLEFTLTQMEVEQGSGAGKTVSPELDVLFLRYYSRFQNPFDVIGSSHNGSVISASYWDGPGSGPGIPADGTNKFLAALENGRGDASTPAPGLLNVYVYHPLQRDIWGDHFTPDGLVNPNTSLPFDFGPTFVPRPNIIPELGRWYCYELMLRANTPGMLDGRIAFWVDGKLAADFPNLRLRDIDTLKIDRFTIGLHSWSNPSATKKWYDNVVAAKSYIGPLKQ